MTGHRLLFVSFALVLVACSDPARDSGSEAPEPDADTVATVVVGNEEKGFACPVTLPPRPRFEPEEPEAAIYTENFPEPETYPTEYPGEQSVWYGANGLWTVLPLDGLFDERKTVFWSTNFPGGTVEEQPELGVTWTRLDSEKDRVVDNDGSATNGYTPEHGWFMITGTEVLGAGCWQVDATYKGATLTYVYEKS
ncbi:MAG: hypothetical protein PVG83_04760 [Acidimicrobiia bacterium]